MTSNLEPQNWNLFTPQAPRLAVGPVWFRSLSLAATVLLVAAGQAARAETPARAVALLSWSDSETSAMILEGIREGLLRTRIPVRMDEVLCGGDEGRAAEALRRWRSEGAEIFLAVEPGAARFLIREVKDRPVIFASPKDPVLSGIVKNLGPSGGNVAGVCLAPDALEVFGFFRDAVPGLARLGVLLSTGPSGSSAEVRAAELALGSPGAAARGFETALVKSTVDPAGGDQGLERAMAVLFTERVQAVWIPDDPFLVERLVTIARISNEARVPLVATHPQGVRRHMVAGIAPDYRKLGVKAAAAAAKVLRGAQPGEMPVGVVRSFHAIVNLKAAERAGITVPLKALVEADMILNRDGW